MEQVTYDKSRVCQIPPTLVKSGNWRQIPTTSLVSLSEQTIAAFLQLATALVYLFLGVVSSKAYGIMGEFLYEYTNLWPYSGSISLFSVVILPLVIFIIGIVLFYGLGISNEKSWNRSLLINFLGIILLLTFFLPVLSHVQSIYSNSWNPAEWFIQLVYSYENVWEILFYLVPLTMILNLASVIYLGARHLSVTSTSNQDREEG